MKNPVVTVAYWNEPLSVGQIAKSVKERKEGFWDF